MAYVLITGATSGLGKEFAFNFASKGLDLILVSRNKEKLEAVKKEISAQQSVEVITFPIDLTKENSPKKVHDFCLENNYEVSALVNNAGYGDFNEFTDGNLKKYQDMINLNDKALVSLCYYFINDMKKNHYGKVINIASIASFMPGPYMAVYYASKAFVLSFSLALNEECKKDGVDVLALCPGPLDTAFWDKANVKMSDFKKEYLARSPKECADTGMKMLDTNKSYTIDGPVNKLAVSLLKLIPLSCVSRIVAIGFNKLKK